MKTPSLPGLVLAMDIGTSSLRTALFSLEGRRAVATTSQHAYALRAGELSPQALLAAALRALRETLARQEADPKLGRLPILGWGFSCFWHSLLGLDAGLAPLTPIYTWADSRCAPDAARLRAKFDEAQTHARTGCMLRASYWPAKLAWLSRTEQALRRRVKHWVSPVDYLHAAFCGEFRPSLSMLSGAGLLDLSTLTWDSALADEVDFRPTYDSGFAATTPLRVSDRFARRFPRLKDVPLFPAIGDGAAGNLGSGATSRRLAALNYGTSAAVRVVRTGKYQAPPLGIFCYAIERDRWLLGGATSNAGNAFHWASEVFQPKGSTTAAADPALVALPFLNGERAPTWCEELPAVLLGMRPHHTARDLQRAFTQATYVRLAQIVAPLEAAAGGDRLQFVISGGIARSGPSVRRLIDTLDRTCRVSLEPEASLRGAAVFALEKLGRQLPPVVLSQEIKPNRAAAQEAAKARTRQTMLEEGMRELFARWQQTTRARSGSL